MSERIFRELDGIFFRIKIGDEYKNVCFSDMTSEEIDEVIGDKDAEWWKAVAKHLAECLQEIGHQFNIVARLPEEMDNYGE